MADDNQPNNKVEIDVEKHLLGLTVKLSNGTEGRIFSRGPRNEAKAFMYNCHLCGVPNLPGERCLQTHIAGRKHQTRLAIPIVDCEQFRTQMTQKNKIQIQIAPGEPVPPGMENEVKPVAQLQPAIDKYKDGPLVGLEYIMELLMGPTKCPLYHCVLCDKRGDPTTIMTHIVSHNHRTKFLEKHFPSVTKELAPIRNIRDTRISINIVVQNVCEAIECHHGRLTPNVHDNNDYNRNKMKYLQEVIFDKHFDERNGPKFVDVIDKKLLMMPNREISPPKVNPPQRKIRAKKDRRSLDSISSLSSDSDVQHVSTRPRSRSPSKKGPSKKTRITKSRSRSRSRSRSPPPAADYYSKYPTHPSKYQQPYPPPYMDPYAYYPPNRHPGPPAYVRPPYIPHPPAGYYPSYDKRERERSTRDRDRDRERERDRSPHYNDRKSPSRHRRSPSPPRRERRSRSRSRSRERRKSPTNGGKWKPLPTPQQLSIQSTEIATEKYKWEKYRCSVELAVKDIEKIYDEHEKNPEKHLFYPDEWKKFWNRRYKELQAEKKDPTKHDFKPEWIEFWTKRMKELRDEEITDKKKEIRKKLELPEEGEERTEQLKEKYIVPVAEKKKKKESSDEEVDDDRRSVHSKASSRRRRERSARRSRSPLSDVDETSRQSYGSRGREFMEYDHHKTAAYVEQQQNYDEWRKNYYGHNKKVFVRTEYDARNEGPLTFVAVCRLLTALEDYMGSLGPKVNDLLAKALALEKVKANSADDMLLNEDYCVFLETVKEKLKGHLMAGMLESHKVNPVKRAIKNIASLIHEASLREKQLEKDKANGKSTSDMAAQRAVSNPTPAPSSEPTKPIIPRTSSGEIDKIAIAKKIAQALIAQGKVDFTTEELEQLINVYIKMAEGKTSEGEPKPKPAEPQPVVAEKEKPVEVKEPEKPKETPVAIDDDQGSALESLTDSDLQTLLQNFKDLSSEEQLHLISYLKKLESTDPLRVEKLRSYVNLGNKAGEKKPNDPKNEKIFEDEDYFEDVGTSKQLNKEEDKKSTNKAATVISDLAPGTEFLDSDDDYSYDDVWRAASKNISTNDKKKKAAEEKAAQEKEDENSNSKASNATEENSGAMTMTDTQNLIANLMGSLKNTINRTPPTGQPIQTIETVASVPVQLPRQPAPQQLQPIPQPQQHAPPVQLPPPQQIQNANMPYYYQQQQNQPNMQYGGYPNNPYPNQRPPFRPPMNNFYPNQNMYGQQQPPNMGPYNNNYY